MHISTSEEAAKIHSVAIRLATGTRPLIQNRQKLPAASLILCHTVQVKFEIQCHTVQVKSEAAIN